VTAPTYRLTGTLQAVTTGSVGGVLPANMTEGELVVFITGMFGGGSEEDPEPNWTAGNTPVAWTPVLGTGIKKRTDVGSDYAGGVWVKEYVAADWTNPAVGFVSSDTQAKYGMLPVFSKPYSGSIVIEGADWSDGPATGLRTGPSIVVTTAPATIVQCFIIVDDGVVALDLTDPGYTLPADGVAQQGSSVSFNSRLVIVTRLVTAPGTYAGAVLTDPGSNSDHWVCIGFSLPEVVEEERREIWWPWQPSRRQQELERLAREAEEKPKRRKKKARPKPVDPEVAALVEALATVAPEIELPPVGPDTTIADLMLPAPLLARMVAYRAALQEADDEQAAMLLLLAAA
jgi:hypothetical protein